MASNLFAVLDSRRCETAIREGGLSDLTKCALCGISINPYGEMVNNPEVRKVIQFENESHAIFFHQECWKVFKKEG